MKKTDIHQKNNDSAEIKRIFEKYDICHIFPKIKEKYLVTIFDRIAYDYRIMDNQDFTTSKWDRKSGFLFKCCIILGGAILSIFKTIKIRKRIKNKINIWNTKIIALPFADHIVRFKRLREIVSQDIDIYYHPIFHHKSMVKHIRTFNDLKQPIFLDSFDLYDIIKTSYLIISNYKKLSKCSYELDNYFKSYTCKLPGIIIFWYLYSVTFIRFINKLENPNNRRIWLFDYDFDYKYAIFNNVIHTYRTKDITIHIQHGSFAGYSHSYCNPACDISLCCSPRELDLINRYNKNHSSIISLGAPLQTFIDDAVLNRYYPHYDVLILLGPTYSELLKKKQIEYLSKFNFNKYNVLIRYRPASKIEDEKILSKYCTQATISEDTCLTEDILSSKIVISFSMDALYTCLRYNKRLIMICTNDPSTDYKAISSTNIRLTSDLSADNIYNLDDLISNYMDCDYSIDKEVLYNFGINTKEQLSDRFKLILNNI